MSLCWCTRCSILKKGKGWLVQVGYEKDLETCEKTNIAKGGYSPHKTLKEDLGSLGMNWNVIRNTKVL